MQTYEQDRPPTRVDLAQYASWFSVGNEGIIRNDPLTHHHLWVRPKQGWFSIKGTLINDTLVFSFGPKRFIPGDSLSNHPVAQLEFPGFRGNRLEIPKERTRASCFEGTLAWVVLKGNLQEAKHLLCGVGGVPILSHTSDGE